MRGSEIEFADLSAHHDLRRMLVERRRELQDEIQSRVRHVREERAISDNRTAGLGEPLDAEPEDDLAFALIQLKGEMLEKVNEAMRRMDEGAYGRCTDCGELIDASRLRAMPFAVRCRDCEQTRENHLRRQRRDSQRVMAGTALRH
jgi:DnaK suppressor protein